MLASSSSFRTRALFWNQHFSQSPYQPLFSHTLQRLLRIQFPEVKYSLFAAERGPQQPSSHWHFQGYLEFKNPLTVSAFARRLTLFWQQAFPALAHPPFFSEATVRHGSRQQALDYVRKTGSFQDRHSEQLDQPFEIGTPFLVRKFNDADPAIPTDLDGQKVTLDHRLSLGYYRQFADIKEDMRLLFVSNQKFCKNLWDAYHPVQTLDVQPLEVIWVYGPSNVGKSTWTNQYIKTRGYHDHDVCCKSYEGVDKVWFDVRDEGKKVLWIEEVRRDFPNNNKLIKIIDRKDWLPVKGSQIRNTFELLIVNSLDAPETVYSHLQQGNQLEVLRRIYLGHHSKVYRLARSHPDYNHLFDLTAQLPPLLAKHVNGSFSSSATSPLPSRQRRLPSRSFFSHRSLLWWFFFLFLLFFFLLGCFSFSKWFFF